MGILNAMFIYEFYNTKLHEIKKDNCQK